MALMGNRSNTRLPEFVPFTMLMQNTKKKNATDGMTGKQIIGYIASKL